MAEEELGNKQTAWVRGATNTKMGRAILTTQRIVFFDEKFSSNAAFGVLSELITDRLQKRHEEGGPLLDLPLASITRISREKKLLNKEPDLPLHRRRRVSLQRRVEGLESAPSPDAHV